MFIGGYRVYGGLARSCCAGGRTGVERVGGGWGGGALDDEGAVGGTEGDLLLVEGEQDAAAEFAHDAVALVDHDADVEGIDDLVAADLVDAEDVGVGDDDVLEGLVLAGLDGEGFENGDDAVGIFAGVDGDVEGADGEVAGEIGDGGDLAVGHDVDGAVCVAELGDAEGEVFDGAGEAGDADDVADRVLIFDEDEDAGEHVLEDGLRAEADAQADDAGRGDEGAERDAECGENLGEEIEADDGVGGGTQDGRHGAELRRTLGVADKAVGAAVQTLDEERDDGLKDEGQQKGEDELGDSVLDEVGEIELPALLEVREEVLVVGDGAGEVRGWGGKLHDGGGVLGAFAKDRILERCGWAMRWPISEEAGLWMWKERTTLMMAE